jgi:hypothetical protein
MANLGYRSVEVMLTNDTRGNLTVQAVALGAGNSWIQGETPNQGDPLPQYSGCQWGVSTNDVNGSASGQIQLTGLGSWPVSISFNNGATGNSTCSVAANDQVQGLVQQMQTGEMNHSLFTVQLIPVS